MEMSLIQQSDRYPQPWIGASVLPTNSNSFYAAVAHLPSLVMIWSSMPSGPLNKSFLSGTLNS